MVKPKLFTLIELTIVLAILGTLLSIAMPRFARNVKLAREAALKENLRVIRKSLQEFYTDKNKFPGTLEELASEKYISFVPKDPFTGENSWDSIQGDEGGGVTDIRSLSEEIGEDGTPVAAW